MKYTFAHTLALRRLPLFVTGVFLIGYLAGCTKQESAQKKEEDSIAVVKVENRRLRTETELPASFEAYQDVPLHAKVEGFISWIGVDRGYKVKKGQALILIEAPEVDAKVKEAQSKVSASQATYHQALAMLRSTINRRQEAEARLEADRTTYLRMKEAYEEYAPAIAKNDLDISEKAVAADLARVQSYENEIQAARNLIQSEQRAVDAAEHLCEALNSLQQYLTISAPFDGVISERNVHEGSIVGVDADRTKFVEPLLRIQQIDPLRVVVAVPEDYVGGVQIGDKLSFSVPAFPGKLFTGTLVRPAYALERRTRTMPVELNFPNPQNILEPGMYATIKWPIRRMYDTMFVPNSAVKTDLKGSFVDKIEENKIKKTKVLPGQTMGSLVEIIQGLASGDIVALKADDELKTDSAVKTHPANKKDLSEASESAG